ncbi:MAG: hypothetical protein KA886_04170 [Candidatus Cloacimonetes bacterium]|nr:hypothetical protein [Candidatus Cloacimonadota bacterium]
MSEGRKLFYEKSLIWAKTEEQKLYSWMSPVKIEKLMSDKKKVFTMSNIHSDTLINKCEFIEQTDLYEFKLYSGAKIICSEFVEFNIERIWVPLKEINLHEKIVEFNILNNHYFESYAVSVKKVENVKAYIIDSADHVGIVNSFLVKLN